LELELGPLREEILDLLRKNVCEITFKKVNGDERIMPCTLQPDLLPEQNQKELTLETVRERKGDAVSVWCTDQQAWRSFKLSNFISIRKINDDQ
jgi:hypothetical protein